MDVLPLKTYPTELLLELAFAAHRVNQGYVKQTRRYSERPPVFSNKELVSLTVHEAWRPEDFVTLEITQEDRDAKAAADKYMRKYTMLALGNLSKFEEDIFAAYSAKENQISRCGMLAYVPQFVENELQAKLYKQRLKSEFSGSYAITSKKIEGHLEILKCIYSTRYETFFYTAGFEGNLVMFSKQEELTVGQEFGFRANVKNQITDSDTGLIINRINYVKLLKAKK